MARSLAISNGGIVASSVPPTFQVDELLSSAHRSRSVVPAQAEVRWRGHPPELVVPSRSGMGAVRPARLRFRTCQAQAWCESKAWTTPIVSVTERRSNPWTCGNACGPYQREPLCIAHPVKVGRSVVARRPRYGAVRGVTGWYANRGGRGRGGMFWWPAALGGRIGAGF